MISLYTGVSGLAAHQQAVDVIANNIANINTVGFKAARVTFEDALSQTLAGGGTSTNPVQVGLGVAVGSIDPDMTQGALQATGRSGDLAIQGGGFFVLGDGQSMSYTRAGGFGLDANNRLVSLSNGMAVLGWQADPATGVVDNSPTLSPTSSLTIPIGTLALARATGNVVYQANLDSETAVAGTVQTSFYVYDSLGNSHRVDLTFTKTAPGTWDWSATGPDADPATPASTGTISFDANGQTQVDSASCSLALLAPNGATSPVNFTIDFSAVTSLAGESTVRAVSQDGLAMGWLESYSIDPSGTIVGSFSNGLTQNLGQIALAAFSNPAGLTRMGGNTYAPSANSGVPVITTAGNGGCGTIASNYLERSNVDLAQQFADLIVTQRGFQANSRVITTSDDMLQELINMKR